jgi:hypothetical protein
MPEVNDNGDRMSLSFPAPPLGTEPVSYPAFSVDLDTCYFCGLEQRL